MARGILEASRVVESEGNEMGLEDEKVNGAGGVNQKGFDVEAFLVAGEDPVWERVSKYCLDPEGYEGSFRRKLVRETGCSFEMAGRAMVEYKRFIYLCARAERMLTPSELVDHAWHLHLLDTKRYWGEFCPRVLGKVIHHEPERMVGEAKKGEDPERFRGAYEYTLGYYQRVFEVRADPEVWPGVDERFGPERFVRVDRRRFWVLRKGILRGMFGRWFFWGLVGVMVMAGCLRMSDVLERV